jgi:hypothetical protein
MKTSPLRRASRTGLKTCLATSTVAPKSVSVHRREVYDLIQASRAASGNGWEHGPVAATAPFGSA